MRPEESILDFIVNQSLLRFFMAISLILFLAAPIIALIYKKWDILIATLKGKDGIPTVQELRSMVNTFIVPVFAVLFAFMVITIGALGWHYDSELYYLCIGVIVGGGVSSKEFAGFISIIRGKKKVV